MGDAPGLGARDGVHVLKVASGKVARHNTRLRSRDEMQTQTQTQINVGKQLSVTMAQTVFGSNGLRLLGRTSSGRQASRMWT